MTKETRLWLGYAVKFLLGKRRYLSPFPPMSYNRFHRVFDRAERKSFGVFIRDSADWIQIEHIFLNEDFRLDKTGRESDIQELYDSIVERGRKPLIIDLGANIGLASRYFKMRYPSAKVVAIEPDQGNFRVARANVLDDTEVINAAISSQKGKGILINLGANNAFRVERNGAGDLDFMTVNEILASAPDSVPFLIKIDIEGFEDDLFSSNTDWMDRFPLIIVELHDWMLPGAQVSRHFLREVAKRDREFMHFDGYVVSFNRQAAVQ